MYTFNFESLTVWQEARSLNVKIYKLTDGFPTEEKFGLTSQIRRASISVLLNIAEGSGKKHKNDQNRFYGIAYGSLMEVMSALLISVDLEYINEEKANDFRPEIAKIAAKINALCKAGM